MIAPTKIEKNWLLSAPTALRDFLMIWYKPLNNKPTTTIPNKIIPKPFSNFTICPVGDTSEILIKTNGVSVANDVRATRVKRGFEVFGSSAPSFENRHAKR